MRKMLWAEWRKLRRSSIILLTVFATVLIAVIVLVAGRETTVDRFYLSDAGWYMTMVQPWAKMLGGISLKTGYRLLKKGEIESFSIGRIYRIPKISILQYLGLNEESNA